VGSVKGNFNSLYNKIKKYAVGSDIKGKDTGLRVPYFKELMYYL
jgi:hypothetical protein